MKSVPLVGGVALAHKMGGEFSSCLLCFDGDAGPYADSHRYTRFEDLQLDKELGHGARAAGAAETPPLSRARRRAPAPGSRRCCSSAPRSF